MKLFHNDVKYLTSIMSCSKGILQEEMKRLNLCKIIPCDIFLTLPDNHMQTNKLLIKLLYNNVKNVIYILNCYIGPSECLLAMMQNLHIDNQFSLFL